MYNRRQVANHPEMDHVLESALLYIAGTPLSAAIPLTIIVAIIISFISTLIISEIYTFPDLAWNNEVVGIKFSYFGELFAVSLGLALIGAYGLYMGVREVSITEVTALRSLFHSEVTQIGEPHGAASLERRDALIAYAKSVVDEEWSLLPQNRASENTTIKLQKLFDAYRIDSKNNPLITTELSWLNDLVKSRVMRTTTLTRSLSLLVWIILLIGTIMSLVLPLFIGTRYFFTHVILSSLFLSFVLLHLLFILHLAYPFTGEVGISTAVYVDFLKEVDLINSTLSAP